MTRIRPYYPRYVGWSVWYYRTSYDTLATVTEFSTRRLARTHARALRQIEPGSHDICIHRMAYRDAHASLPTHIPYPTRR